AQRTLIQWCTLTRKRMNDFERAQTVSCLCVFFFFQAEDGIRDFHVTGVQTCALPICCSVDSYLGLVLLAKATSSHVSVLSLQKAIAFSVSTTVVLVPHLETLIVFSERERSFLQ